MQPLKRAEELLNGLWRLRGRHLWLLAPLVVLSLPSGCFAWFLEPDGDLLSLRVLPAFAVLVLFVREAVVRVAAIDYGDTKLGWLGPVGTGVGGSVSRHGWPVVVDGRTARRVLTELLPVAIVVLIRLAWPTVSESDRADALILAASLIGLPLLYVTVTHWHRLGAEYPYAGWPVQDGVAVYLAYSLTFFVVFRAAFGQPAVVGPIVIYALAMALAFLVCLRWFLHRRPPVISPTVPITLLLAGAPALMFAIAYGTAWLLVGGQGPAASRWAVPGLAWSLTVLPALCGLPIFSLALAERERVPEPEPPDADKRSGAAARIVPVSQRHFLYEQMENHLVRGHRVTLAILGRHARFFALGLPPSLVVALAPAMKGQIDALNFGPAFAELGVWVWLSGTAGWVIPLVYELYNIQDTLAAAYARGLRRCIHKLRAHVLVLGFGDIGRALVREQLEKRVIGYGSRYEHLVFSQNILLPDGRLAKVLMRLAAVDADPALLGAAIKTPEGLAITTTEVTHSARNAARLDDSLTHRRDEPLTRIVIPMIGGDATREEVQQMSRLADAAFVVSLIRDNTDQDRSQSLLHRLEALSRTRGRIPSCLAIHSSTFVPYVTARVLARDLQTHYIFPEFLEGLNAGNVLYAAFLKLGGFDASVRPRLLVCGRGRRVGYILDAFLKNFSASEHETLRRWQTEKPTVFVMGERSVLSQLGRKPKAGAWQDWAGQHKLSELREIRIGQRVARDPVANSPTGKAHPVPAGVPISVPHVELDPRLYDSWDAVLAGIRPHVILISDQSGEDELRILNALVNNINRRQAVSAEGPELPLILISGETGKRHVAKKFEDALLYYSSLWRGPQTPGLQPPAEPDLRIDYPTPGLYKGQDVENFRGDPLIDVLDEPVQRITGLIRAYERAGALFDAGDRVPAPESPAADANSIAASSEPPHGLDDRVAVELDCCSPDVPGAIATALARLAGYSPGVSKPSPAGVPSFSHSRIVTLSNNGFLIKSFASLEPLQSDDPVVFSRLAAVCGQTPEPASGSSDPERARAVARMEHTRYVLWYAQRLLAPLDGGHRSGVIDTFEQTFHPPSEPNGKKPPDDGLETLTSAYREQVNQCCGMLNCPVEGFHKSIEALGETYLGQKIYEPKLRKMHAESVLRRFVIGTVDANHPSLALRTLPPRQLASIKLGCTGAEKPGAFAHVLNAMLLRTLTLVPDAQRIFNFTYVSSYECHDQRFGVFTCYGTLERRPAEGCRIQDLLRYVEIRPTGCYDPWKRYAEALREFLNEQAGGEHYQLGKFGQDADGLSGRALVIYTSGPPSPYLAESERRGVRVS
jgi:hypothetical protein